MNVRDARRRRGITQAHLAQLAGVSESTVKRVEAGTHVPTVVHLAAIAEVLGVTVDALIEPPDPPLAGVDGAGQTNGG